MTDSIIAIIAVITGRLDSVEWNGGMEWWNGMVEWNSGITRPVQQPFPDDLYPISDNGLVRSRHNIMESVVLRSGKVSECQDGAQDDWLNPLVIKNLAT